VQSLSRAVAVVLARTVLVIWSDGKCEPTGPTLVEMLVYGLKPAPLYGLQIADVRLVSAEASAVLHWQIERAVEPLLWEIESEESDDEAAMLRMFEALADHDERLEKALESQEIR
jgi:hypothetical protein